MTQWWNRIRAFVTEHQFPAGVAAAAAVLLACFIWLGVSSHRRANVLRAEALRMDSVSVAAQRWITVFQPATADESDEWQHTKLDIRRSAMPASNRLTLAQDVARAAEDVGLAGVRVHFTATDSVSPIERQVGTTTFRSSPYALAVQFQGDIREVADVLPDFPASVTPRSVQITGDAGARSVNVLLDVFQPVEAPQ